MKELNVDNKIGLHCNEIKAKLRKGPDGKQVGKIPKNQKGLYRVEHDSKTANSAMENITLDQFAGHVV